MLNLLGLDEFALFGEIFRRTHSGGLMKRNGLNKIVRLVMITLMAIPLPNMALAAKVQKEMVSASGVFNEINFVSSSPRRHQQEKEIQAFLQNSDIKAQLRDKGVSAEEMTSRLASLSDQELQTMSTQVKQARAGGDLLVTVLVIVLIIYFIKRI